MMGEWKLFQPRRRRGGGRDEGQQGQKGLAREILQCIFAAPPRKQGQEHRGEWRCGCGRTNWMDRQACRICGAAKSQQQQGGPKCGQRSGQGSAQPGRQTLPAGPSASPPRAQPPVQQTSQETRVPWKAAEEAKTAASQRRAALEAAIAAATAKEADESVLKDLRGLLDSIETPKEKPADDKLTATKGFVERQTRRLMQADEEIAKLQEAREQMKKDLDEAMLRQEALEQQVRVETRQGQGIEKVLQTLCADLTGLVALTGRKKQRTEEPDQAKPEERAAEGDAAMEPAAAEPAEEVKAVLMQLAQLGTKLQEVLQSTAPTQKQ